MKTILNQLYDGEIFPAEQIVPQDPAYHALVHRLSDEHEDLKRLLGKEAGDRLDALRNGHYQVSYMDCYANFSCGLRMGIQLMCAVFADENDDR